MGREIRRVPIDFAWPVNTIWEGFLMPERLWAKKCGMCDGSGFNPASKAIYDAWYNFGGPPFSGICYNLEQADVDALVEAGRLMDFTHTWTRGKGWERRADGYLPTAAEVNAWARTGMGHDSINCSIAVNARAKRLGVHGVCPICDGDGSVYPSPAIKAEAEAWQATNPPTGEGWQLWETVTEGSPISPVFESAEALARWISQYQDMAYHHALAFVNEGWAPSLIGSGGFLKDGMHVIGADAAGS